MRQITLIILGLSLSFFSSCRQGDKETSGNVMEKFEAFIIKEKFVQDEKLFYPGIGDETLTPILTKKINLAADNFRKLANKGGATDKEYQDAIRDGLEHFSEIYFQLDTEDKERVCTYFEELMEIVELESSGGHLNNFMYGFDPRKK